jgi:hypothetical protein
MLDVHPDAAAIFKDVSRDALACRSHDHGEPPFLTVTPNVGGFAAQGRFVKISLCHGDNYILQVSLPYAKM